MNVKVLKRILQIEMKKRNIDIDIVVADGGQGGIEAYQESRPSLCIIDYHMPDIDGMEATRIIRRYEDEQDIPRSHILIYTADGTERALQQAIDCGADEVMSKPAPKEYVSNLIKSLVVTS